MRERTDEETRNDKEDEGCEAEARFRGKIESFMLNVMRAAAVEIKKSVTEELRNEQRREVVIEHLMAAFDKFVLVALDGTKQWVKYYVPNAKDPLAVAVSLICRAADIQVDSTEDPKEKARILKEAALDVTQLPALCRAESQPSYAEDECECECVDDGDDDLEG